MNFFTKCGAAVLLTLAPIALHAQNSRTIAYGRTSVTLTPAFVQALSGSGVSITDLNLVPLQSGLNTFTAINGVLDLQTSFGEVEFSGGYQITVNGQTIRVQDLTFEIQNATTAYISGVFIVNGTFQARQTIFTVNMAPTYTLPLQLDNGALTLPAMSLGLSPTFVSLLNSAVGQNAFNAGTQVATANEYAVFGPTTPEGIN